MEVQPSARAAERATAERLLVKLRQFVKDGLDADERRLFAALVAPAIAAAVGDEVHGFGMTSWSPAALPDALAEAVRGGSSPLS